MVDARTIGREMSLTGIGLQVKTSLWPMRMWGWLGFCGIWVFRKSGANLGQVSIMPNPLTSGSLASGVGMIRKFEKRE